MSESWVGPHSGDPAAEYHRDEAVRVIAHVRFCGVVIPEMTIFVNKHMYAELKKVGSVNAYIRSRVLNEVSASLNIASVALDIGGRPFDEV